MVERRGQGVLRCGSGRDLQRPYFHARDSGYGPVNVTNPREFGVTLNYKW